jgi:hypothetical protein
LNHIVNPLAPLAHPKAPDRVTLSHWFRWANGYLDKCIHVYFGPVALLFLSMAISELKDTHRNASKLSHDSKFLMCEANPRVGYDWLRSSSKLQPCLELCQFAQVHLKTKVVRWKSHFLLGIYEKTHVQYTSERMACYSRYTTGNNGVALRVS